MRNAKYYIAIDDCERRIIINCLSNLRNRLLAEGRYSDAVDDILINTPVRKFKIKITEV